MAAVHISPFAGSWFPDEPGELSDLVKTLFERSRHRTGSHVLPGGRGFVVPHAGLKYSGGVAAAAYRHIRELRPRRVVLLGFAHRGGPDDVVIADAERIAVPTGEVLVDTAGLPFPRSDNVCDHSLEIQLPLLVEAVPGVPVVPLYVGRLDPGERRQAATALARIAEPDTVFVASSDFTHYGRGFGYLPFPVDEDTPARLWGLDEASMEAASSLDSELFLGHLRRTGSTVCGYNPIALLLETLQVLGGDFYQQTLDYQTSGEITGEWDHTVSYAALGYFPACAFELTSEEQDLLLESSHRTLDVLLRTGERKPVPPRAMTPNLARHAGAFVTLHESGELRGCIGHRVGTEPLAVSVPELTLSAALEDPRFEPLREAKGPIDIEISVLTPMRRIRDCTGFQLGRHGVYFESAGCRSLLLPQVAHHREWTREEFLGALCRKSGLGTQAWRDRKAHLHVFEAQVFGGKPLGNSR